MNTIKSFPFALTSSYGLCAYFLPFRLIKESVYPMYSRTSNVGTFWKKLILGKTIWTSNEIIVFHHAWYENYYHWTTECLTRLLPCTKKYPNAKILLPSNLASFHIEQLQLLGIENEKIIFLQPDYQLLASKTILLPINGLIFGRHDFDMVKLIADKFLNSITKTQTHSKNYYLSRKNAPKRKAVNEDDVQLLLKNLNFDVVIVENMSVIEQFVLFASAKMVVGVHGSYFVNGICMQPGSHVIDIMEKRHNDDCYENLLKPFGITYHYLLSEGIGNEENFRDNDLNVDCEKLKSLIKSLL